AHSGSYYALILCNILIPQLLWLRWVRLNVYVLWIITIVINIGMWLERYVIVVNSLERDFLPSSWDEFVPTIWDWLTYLGTIGLFIFLLMLFIRFVPMLAIAEIQALHHENKHASSPKREEHS
ncbi:MAG: hydrogenase, partial [Candidatus Hydrogenedentes bacterium]|nr:hydrogenase [Candidatus Hydrogenedentota bacterium]